MYEFAVTPAITQLRRPGVLITEVEPLSLAEELELQPNDRIVRVNGRSVRDYLDFRFQVSGETEMTLLIKKASGESWEVELEREEGEDFGLSFEQIVPRQCANECLFCFCKGNPETARPSLFIRDEDIRLSFLYGNYTTLTSITDDEMKRIIEQRLSPQYVSIHATDLKTRAYLLGVDEKRADISAKIDKLLKNDIEIHAQVVLCPTINDGEILQKTVRDLAALYPQVVSVAIVPLGLTRYNNDERLACVSPEFCRKTIKEIAPLQKEFRQKFGKTFAFLGDEIYLKAGLEIPSRRHYGNYPQIEDGVGMVRSFTNSFEKLMKRLSKQSRESSVESQASKALKTQDSRLKTQDSKLFGTILTGEYFAPILSEMIARYNQTFGANLHVLAVKNEYFGGDVGVAGLLTGGDYLRVREQIKGDFVIIPAHTVKSDEPILLDGISFDELKSNFKQPIHALDTSAFMEMLEIGNISAESHIENSINAVRYKTSTSGFTTV